MFLWTEFSGDCKVLDSVKQTLYCSLKRCINKTIQYLLPLKFEPCLYQPACSDKWLCEERNFSHFFLKPLFKILFTEGKTFFHTLFLSMKLSKTKTVLIRVLIELRCIVGWILKITWLWATQCRRNVIGAKWQNVIIRIFTFTGKHFRANRLYSEVNWKENS